MRTIEGGLGCWWIETQSARGETVRSRSWALPLGAILVLVMVIAKGDDSEAAVVAALRARDEQTFTRFVNTNTPAMLRVARGYVASRQIAEEVVQDSWIALIKGISKFEGRASLRTWLFAIVINTAKARGLRERRIADTELAAFAGTTVDPGRFRGSTDLLAGHWKEEPRAFPETPEGSLLRHELVMIAQKQLDRLPDSQRNVVMLRDMLDFESAEVCQLLSLTATNQRVLLHRGRAVVRQALEEYLKEKP